MLGPLEVRDDADGHVELGAPKLRAVLQVLALEPRHVVPTERLVEDVWDHDPPPRALVSLRSYISNLRRALQRHDGAAVVVTRGQGYLLDVQPDELDTCRFEQLALAGRTALGAGEPIRAIEQLDEALGLWRGAALADIAQLVVAAAPAARLEQLRTNAREDRLAALLELGEHDQVVADAEELVRGDPVSERPHRLLVLALHRAGRTPEALDVHRGFRQRLGDELGLDPSPEFDDLAARLLRHDPALVAPSRPRAAPQAPSRVALPATGSAGATPHWATTLDAALVGRRSERRHLSAAVDGLAAGRGGVVALAGEAGIGKTSLLAHAVLHARQVGAPVAVGRCSETPGAPPFWPWTQVLEGVHDALGAQAWTAAVGEHGAELALVVPELVSATAPSDVGAPTDAHAARFALHRAIADVLAAAARPHGLVVVIDDLHWADLASAELVAHLTTVAFDTRIVLLTSHRDTAADGTPALTLALDAVHRNPAVERLQLLGLDPVEVAELLDTFDLATGAPDSHVLRNRTGGNPFHLRQLAEVLRDGGDVANVPPGVRQVLSSRLDRLPPSVRATLEVGAVLGGTADPRLLAEVAGRPVPDVLDDLDVAANHGLLAAPSVREPVAFAHALVRETILECLPLGRRIRLHAAAGEALAARPDHAVEEVAEHFSQAADVVGTERAVDALRAAAAAAYHVYASERAEQLLRQALDLLLHGGSGPADRELAVRVQLVHVLKGLHGWTAEVLVEHLEEVRSLSARLGASAELMPMWWSLWALHMTRGELDDAIGVAGELLAGADPDTPHTVVAGHVAVGYTQLFRGADPAVVLDHVAAAEAAHDHASPDGLAGVPEHLSLALAVTRALLHAFQGDAASCMATVDRAVQIAESRDEPFRIGYARLFGAWCCALLDLPAGAAEHGDAGVAVCDAAGLPAITALIEPNRAWAHGRLDRDPRPWIDLAREVDGRLAAAGQRHAVAHGRLLLAEVEALAGDPAAAATLASARAMADAIGEHVYAAQFARVEALLDGAAAGPQLTPPRRSSQPAHEGA